MHDQSFFSAEIEEDVFAASLDEIDLRVPQRGRKSVDCNVRCESLPMQRGGTDRAAIYELMQRPGDQFYFWQLWHGGTLLEQTENLKLKSENYLKLDLCVVGKRRFVTQNGARSDDRVAADVATAADDRVADLDIRVCDQITEFSISAFSST